MAPAMETDHSLRNRMARENPVRRPTRTRLDLASGCGDPFAGIVFATGPDGTGDGN